MKPEHVLSELRLQRYFDRRYAALIPSGQEIRNEDMDKVLQLDNWAHTLVNMLQVPVTPRWANMNGLLTHSGTRLRRAHAKQVPYLWELNGQMVEKIHVLGEIQPGAVGRDHDGGFLIAYNGGFYLIRRDLVYNCSWARRYFEPATQIYIV